MNFAHICVEVDASHPLVEEFDVELLQEDGSSSVVPIRVSYQWKSPSCSSCQVFGHTSASCSVSLAPGDAQLEASHSPSEDIASGGDSLSPQLSLDKGWITVGKKGKVSTALGPPPVSSACQVKETGNASLEGLAASKSSQVSTPASRVFKF